MLSKDAYDSVIKDIQSEYTSDMYNLAETRATAIANGADVTSADKAMWDATSSKTESYLQTMLNNTQDMYGKDYNSVLADVWNDHENSTSQRMPDDLVKRLRKKLSEHGCTARIETVWGYGYRITQRNQEVET